MHRILFGDNQFFGVNHMSEDKARAQAIRFQSLEGILKVLDDAYAAGIRVFMCTTHERVAEICSHMRQNPGRYPELEFYPCMPYAHKYANAVTEYGALEAVRRFLPEKGAVGALFKGGMSVARGEVEDIGGMLVDAEMKMFDGLKTPVIFLQNVVTDLFLGLGMARAFRVFADHVRKVYDAEPGFITMNLPMLLDALDGVGVENPIVCANINKIGFRMCGGMQVYEEAIATRRFRPIAMSIFASGAIPAEEAVKYVCDQSRIESIVFGASSAANINRTKQLIDELSVPA
jgi:hypothetical protein